MKVRLLPEAPACSGAELERQSTRLLTGVVGVQVSSLPPILWYDPRMPDQKPPIPSLVYLRYWRKTSEHPAGGVAHDGDCAFYTACVCTCGLLHALRPVDDAARIHPPFDRELGEHDRALARISPS